MLPAYWHQDKLHYIIYEPEEGDNSTSQFRVVAPVDYTNTGAVQQREQHITRQI